MPLSQLRLTLSTPYCSRSPRWLLTATTTVRAFLGSAGRHLFLCILTLRFPLSLFLWFLSLFPASFLKTELFQGKNCHFLASEPSTQVFSKCVCLPFFILSSTSWVSSTVMVHFMHQIGWGYGGDQERGNAQTRMSKESLSDFNLGNQLSTSRLWNLDGDILRRKETINCSLMYNSGSQYPSRISAVVSISPCWRSCVKMLQKHSCTE